MPDRVDDPGTEPDRIKQIEAALRQHSLDMRVAMPAHVLAYNPATQRADVQLGFLPVRVPEGDAEPVADPPIPCPDVPVHFPGAGAAYVSFPIVPGTTGMVIFQDRALAQWLEKGAPADPINGRAHALGDAVFVPGLRPSSGAISPPTSATSTVIEGPLIDLGAGATLQVAIAQALHAYLVAAVTAAPVVPTDGGAAFKAGLLTYLGANPFTAFAAAKVRAV